MMKCNQNSQIFKVLRTFDKLRQDGYDPAALKKHKKVDPCSDPLF